MAGNTIITLSPIQKFSVVFDLWFLKAEFCVAIFHIKLSGIVSKPYHSTFFFPIHTHTMHIFILHLLTSSHYVSSRENNISLCWGSLR